MPNILSLLIITPLVGALLILLVARSRDDSHHTARSIGLIISLLNLVFSLIMMKDFDQTLVSFQMEEKYHWIDLINSSLHLGVDGISLYFVVLTALLVPICIISAWHSIKFRMKDFILAFLFLESFVIGAFLSLDLLVFYFFFEALLIPMYIIIGIWGSDERIYAAFKFFLYTLAGSLLFLLAIYIFILKLRHLICRVYIN